MRKGTVKVMVGRNGASRIQEELDGTIKVYSAKEWSEELARRQAEEIKEPKVKKEKASKTDDKESKLGIEDDVDEEEVKPKSTRKSKAKA